MQKRIRIAQYGIGHNHGSEKMKAFRRFPDLFEVVGVCEPDPSWREKRANLDAYEGIPWLTEEALFNTPGLEAVCVEPDVPYLNEVAQKCVDAGLHIHMDKPGGEDLPGFARLLSDAQRKGLLVQMAYMYRYNPAIQYCIEAAASGALGEIFEIDAQMSTRHDAVYRQWLSQYRGGTMYIFGCHLIDLIHLILGVPEKVTPYLRNTLPGESKAYDNGLAILEYANATCTVRTSSVEVNGYGRRQLVVCGTKGTLEIKPLERPTHTTLARIETIQNHYADTKEVLTFESNGDRYDAQVRDFAAIIRGEKADPYGYAHDLAVQKTTLAACGFAPEELTAALTEC